jgi:hypothetical protein
MEMSTSLDFDVRAIYLNDDTKCAILNTIWGSTHTAQDFSNDPSTGDSYLRYYGDQCRNALHSKGFDSVIKTHADVADIVNHLKQPIMTRERLQDHLRTKVQPPSTNDDDEPLCDIIDLAVRLWLMIDVGKIQHGFVPGQKPLLWEAGSLKDLVQDRFAGLAAVPSRVVRVKLDRLFTARNLERIAGLQIIWTDNISDHLRLMVDDTRIAIYHHVSFLEHHKNNYIFPVGFVQETLRTISLLFPQYDKESRKWFKAQQLKFGLDEKTSTSGHLTTEERQIENFVFWYDRLSILKQAFDEAEPSTLAQWWFDRRRRVQWYTFWLAAVVLTLTVLFGMVQCVEGGFQVYKAYYPS